MRCTVALSSLSYAIWMASMRQKMLRTILVGYQYQIVVNLSGVLSWTGCYVRRPLGNLDLAAADSLVRCTVGKNNPQEWKKGH